MQITAGFIPLLDAAMLVVAKEKGFAEAEGLDLQLVRESSWANIRDRIAIGHFDAAHMLAPMAIAGSLGVGPLPVATVAPIALGAGRNGITVSEALWQRMSDVGADASLAAGPAVAHLAKACREGSSDRKPVFGVVHPYSAHAYLLRYWLAEGGLLPDRDVQIDVVPPPFMPDALASGHLDGCCVGEPWNSVAMEQGAGRLVTTSDAIWHGSPDKLLGFRADWADKHPAAVAKLVRALYAAGIWCDVPANREELARLLALPDYLDTKAELLLPGLGAVRLNDVADLAPVGFVAGHGAFPWMSQCLWFLSQMARWGQVELSAEAVEKAAATYRPDLFRTALEGVAGDIPASDRRIEGSDVASRFFDGRIFDPTSIDAYLSALPTLK